MLLDTCGSLQTVFWGFWLEKLWKLKGTQEIASEAKGMSPLWHLNRVFPCPFEVPLGRFHVPLNIQRDISGASAKLRTPLKNHEPRTIHLWLFTGEGAPAPSPGNSQRWMMPWLVVFQGGKTRPPREIKVERFFYPFENPYPPEMLPKPAGKSQEGSEGRQRATRVGPETPPGFFPRVPV